MFITDIRECLGLLVPGVISIITLVITGCFMGNLHWLLDGLSLEYLALASPANPSVAPADETVANSMAQGEQHLK